MCNRSRNTLAVSRVLVCLFLNPYRHLIRRWNWKAAFLSSTFRGIVILLVNLRAGSDAAVAAMLAEACYRAVTSGFYSSVSQAFRRAQPIWAASIIAMAVPPAFGDTMEFMMHRARGTQRLGATIAASLIISAVSTLFEMFAMRRGILIVGQTSGSLLQDLQTVPELIIAFWNQGKRSLLTPLVLMWKSSKLDLCHSAEIIPSAKDKRRVDEESKQFDGASPKISGMRIKNSLQFIKQVVPF